MSHIEAKDISSSNGKPITAELIKKEVEEKTSPSIYRNRALVDITQELPPPEVAFRIGGEIGGTLGNFSLLIGKAKSKKTFLSVLVMAACLGKIRNANLLEGTLPSGKKRVVFIDTEQGRHHVIKTAQRVTRLLDAVDIESFDVYSARSLNTGERNGLIEEIISNTNDLGLLIIDGVRDIVTSINDEEQATILANNLLKWTEESQIHIITVLHQNKGDFNARGHIGTELINKAETTLSVTVEKDKDISKVEAEYTRNKPFDSFAIRINENGLPEIVDGWVPKDDSAGNTKYAPHEVDDYKHTEILQQVAKNICEKPSYSDVSSQLKLSVSEKVQKIGETKVRDFFTHYLNEGLIQKHGKYRSPNSYYSIHPYGQN